MTWITADFPGLPPEARSKVKAFITCRDDGVSKAQFDSLNIALHVGDSITEVRANRAILRDELKLPSEPFWLHQTHSNCVLNVPYEYRPELAADASFTSSIENVCAVMTADCLPLLIVNQEATEVAVVHAGWRGLATGIIEQTIASMASSASSLHVYLGPAIGPESFEVGEEVRRAFVESNSEFSSCFNQAPEEGKFMANLYQLARIKLQHLGVVHITGGHYCTYKQSDLFYSYRRDGQTGRMASLIWLES